MPSDNLPFPGQVACIQGGTLPETFTFPQRVKGAGVWEGGDMTDLYREPSPPTVPTGQSQPGPWSLCSVWGASQLGAPALEWNLGSPYREMVRAAVQATLKAMV